jgi:hypothetical protein
MDKVRLKRYFNDQKFRSKSRLDKNGNTIQWNLSFNDWLSIWINSGKLNLRGRKKGQYCMSRLNDIGPYSVDNVLIKSCQENIIEGQFGKYIPSHAGKSNPNAKKITIYNITYNTITEAAVAQGITTAGLRYRLLRNHYGTP